MQTSFPKYKNCTFTKIKESTERKSGMSTRVAILAILLLDIVFFRVQRDEDENIALSRFIKKLKLHTFSFFLGTPYNSAL